MTKVCAHCKVEKPTVDFYPRSDHPHLFTSWCRQCDRARSKISHCRTNNPTLERRARFIIDNAKQYDKKRGFKTNLRREFVLNLIQFGCWYCDKEADQCKMTLDRIDNSIGHVEDNVNPSCERCNNMRNSMVYEAWMRLVPTIKELITEGIL